ncbi:MAG: metallopeptidase TldD-related protein [Candidatus Cloacimonetes bacterium]|nr:metallopeptidase TldD-related protein [Candidatus Cloacimonadota bacterium]
MDKRIIMKNALAALKEKGADKASMWLTGKVKEEFNIVYKELNLLRTVESQNLLLVVIKDNKQATTRLNQFDEASVANAIDEVMTSVESSNADPAFDISPMQDPQVFSDGAAQMEADKIVFRLNEFTKTMKHDFPNVYFDASLSFGKYTNYYLNSNGVDYAETGSSYSFMTMFTAKVGRKMSSFNYTGFDIANLDKPLMEINSTRELMRQITEQTETKAIPKNFTGDVILCPFVTGDLLESLISQQFGNSGLLTNSSRFPDHIGQQILHSKLTVYNKPSDERFANKNPITGDGFLAKEAAIIENGVLNHYPIGLFTANKVGKKRTIGDVDNMVVESGLKPLEDIIKSMDMGILCMRASFGQPNANGDMSAVLKNSYYIENGAIQYPISESMMSLNLVDIFNNIKEISYETFNTGSSIFPYMLVGGVAISHK